MNTYEVTAIDRGTEVVLEVPAPTEKQAKIDALRWLPTGAKVIRVRRVEQR